MIWEKTHVDPSALGLFGLAIITLVASSQKLWITDWVAYVIPWAIFLWAFAQIIAWILDYKKGNVFWATAFCAYGFFWLWMALSWFINLWAFWTILQENVDTTQMWFAFVWYLILTVFLTIGAMETNKVLFLIFFFIVFLFLWLSISTFITEWPIHLLFHKVAAISEIIISMLSFYASWANVLNNHFGKEFLPIGKPFWIFK